MEAACRGTGCESWLTGATGPATAAEAMVISPFAGSSRIRVEADAVISVTIHR